MSDDNSGLKVFGAILVAAGIASVVRGHSSRKKERREKDEKERTEKENKERHYADLAERQSRYVALKQKAQGKDFCSYCGTIEPARCNVCKVCLTCSGGYAGLCYSCGE
jgi:hypothetical protein